MNKHNKTYVNASDIGAVTYCPVKKYYDAQKGYTMEDINRMKSRQSAHDEIIYKRAKKQDSRCYIATFVYGINDERTQMLRHWRDKNLSKQFGGKMLIQIYYFLSPLAIKHLGKFECFQRTSKYVLDFITERIEKNG